MTAVTLAAVTLLFAPSCLLLRRQSDRATVGDFLAARLYHEDRYRRACVDFVGPQLGCTEMQDLLQRWKALNRVANDVQKLGDLPPEEKREIRAIWDRVKQLP